MSANTTINEPINWSEIDVRALTQEGESLLAKASDSDLTPGQRRFLETSVQMFQVPNITNYCQQQTQQHGQQSRGAAAASSGGSAPQSSNPGSGTQSRS